MLPPLVINTVCIEETFYNSNVQGEIHILWDMARGPSKLNGIQLRAAIIVDG